MAGDISMKIDRPVRLKIAIRGVVQGVGFRPFVYRLATDLGLTGWVNNSPQGVFIEVESSAAQLRDFLARLPREKPPRAVIQSLDAAWLDPIGYTGFVIRESDQAGEKTTLILPDSATCDDCRHEIFDPRDRRYRYPFTNCTNCGPRFTIIEALPYDRPKTTMKKFPLCEQCRVEYENPRDRRFHAQPNACPVCGPQLELWDSTGHILAERDAALCQAVALTLVGKILAIKGIGGFHLLADARNGAALRSLRLRKHRDEKPLALLYPSLALVQSHCEVDAAEARLLLSPEAPIVLLRRKIDLPDSDGSHNLPAFSLIAPQNPYLGIMLPYTPLHHLLMADLQIPVVATSGNLSDEPICTDEHEALRRLAGIADCFLVHNRPIARHVDDSIVRMVGNREMLLRRARGYAPLPIDIATPVKPMLAVGAHLKNTVAVAKGKQVFLSQHIGDLETPEALAAFHSVIASLSGLYEIVPELVVCDAHPDYLATQFARDLGKPVLTVQHHYAHCLAGMAEHGLTPPVLGIAWDGTGLGSDGTSWGGEFLDIREKSWSRIAHLRPFHLPGGDKAAREPRRMALSLLYEIMGNKIFGDQPPFPDVVQPLWQGFTAQELSLFKAMLERRFQSPRVSSAGRLFDAVSALIGLRRERQFEGQAAMALEFALAGIATDSAYPVAWRGSLMLDWEPMIWGILDDLGHGVAVGLISAKFHNTLVDMMVAVAQRAGIDQIVLGGGCFQNKYLTERAVARLTGEGFRVYWPQRLPPNDGGLALGQIFAATRE